ncbi:copper homeostasis protein CutC [Paeniglutamicibacter cryotolerans]|uniref:PF03932 family protein CutC n=1 Tax=Paeniglutamicibacter cryotolerans TaxID=670079 RepID=A0A839QJ21_9MICC|nr:copper homeostasis protein CutC [Paeniglutamicibacter cryotolerans]MBB2995807.1 copper homeostasis protein [Paeniglutamicibacter cryotolerans]
MTSPRLEIAVQDTAGARIAREHGADRVELCQGLGLGGLTPSQGLIEACVAEGIGVHPLIRPRGGGFSYSPLETEAMLIDIRRAVAAGARGVVIGAVCAGDAGLDSSVLSTLIAAARETAADTEITVHRCVDVLLGAGADPAQLVGQLIGLGVDRVLSSGGASTAGRGIGVLHLMHEAADGRLQIQAGGGVRLEDIPALLRLDGIHLSARTSVSTGASGPGGGESAYDATSPELVAAAAAALVAPGRAANPDASTISDSDVSRAT